MFTKYLSFIKNVSTLIVIGILDYLIPIQPFIQAAFTLVILDLITKVLAVIKIDGYLSIQSGRMKESVIKFFLYLCGIIAAHEVNTLAQAEGVETATYLTFLIAVIIATTEFQSIIENIEYGTEVKIWDKIKKFIPLVKNLFKK
jgi:phage-related holin